ncbi:MAG: hypothetical protein HY753_03710 [Nitrospirae bacterium]|nr:hypothetical protein [Nitrospirota bacterium]
MDIKNLFTGFSNRTYMAGIILGIIAYVFIAEIFLRIYVIPNDELSQVAVSVYESEKRDVIIGDSQFKFGFPKNYALFEDLSYNGMPVETMEIILREYYRHKKPNKVIIIAAPQMLAENRVERGDLGFKEYFKFNAVKLPFMIYAFEKLVSRNLADFFKWIHYKPEQQFKENMWEETAEEKRTEMTLKRIETQRPVKNFQGTRNYKSYYQLLRLLKDKNAKICLLKMPVADEYRQLVRYDKDFLEAETAFKEMAAAYNLKYVDLGQIPLKYDASFFINSDHLNEKGRKLFAPLAEEFCFDR